jgi:hypothetical protein
VEAFDPKSVTFLVHGHGKSRGHDVEEPEVFIMTQTNCAISFALGLGAGAVLMYFSDPRLGRRRRAQVRDQATSIARDTSRYAGKTARHLRNRVRGIVHEARSSMRADAAV